MSLEDFASMDRRALLQRAFALVGSTVVLGACATLPDAALAADPAFALTDAQRATLAALADTILPTRAWASAANRAEMLAGLGRVEALGGGFTALSPAARETALTPHDAAALVITQSAGEGLQALLSGGPRRQDQGYSILRELIVVLYYYSEIGLTQELEWSPIPGRWDPSVPLTASSRSISGGVGNF